MRRISYWALSTLSAIVLLFGYRRLAPRRDRRRHGGRPSPAAPGHVVERRRGLPRLGREQQRLASTSGGSQRSSSASHQTVTGSVAQTQWGPVQVQLTVSTARSPRSTSLQYPNGNSRDDEINHYSLPILIQETMQSAERAHRHGQRRDRTPAPATSSRCRARSTRPTCDRGPSCRLQRYVEHVMGMPVSLALRGRHADDAAARDGPGSGASPSCARSTGSSAPTARTRRSPGSARGEIDLADCPAEVARGARTRRAGAGRVRRRLRRTSARPDGVPDPRPERRRQGVGGRSVRPQHLRALPDTDVCLSAGGDMVCHVADDAASRLAGRHRGPARPARGCSPPSRYAAARSRRPGRPTAAQHIVDARTGAAAGCDRVGHGPRRRPHLGRHRRHRGVRDGRRGPGLAPPPPGTPRPRRLARGWQRRLRHHVLTARKPPHDLAPDRPTPGRGAGGRSTVER